jgi:hypothetical protein
MSSVLLQVTFCSYKKLSISRQAGSEAQKLSATPKIDTKQKAPNLHFTPVDAKFGLPIVLLYIQHCFVIDFVLRF